MGEINYCMLIRRNVGSMASSFANIMQYIDLGILMSEPIRHNATWYGDAYEQNTEASLFFLQ